MYNFSAFTDEQRAQMLVDIGVKNIEELFSQIPQKARIELDLPDSKSEMVVQRELKNLANKNCTDLISFLGGGIYNHFIPAAISTIASRFEFITAYTPYQPEISQGTLQMIYEFQSMICSLTNMDVSNASVYDGATACAEALLMASRIKKKSKVAVSRTINPEYQKVIETYCNAGNIEIIWIDCEDFLTARSVDMQGCAAFLVANPNYFGSFEELQILGEDAHNAGALFVVQADILSLSQLKSPSDFGADIVVGDFQALGIPQNYGGPTGGFMATKSAYMRQLPGRIVGATVDKNGDRAFTLTLQAREQHIRREKATSNICTNQGLMTLIASVYMSLMGQKGMSEVFLASVQNSKKLASSLSQIKGFEVQNPSFAYEFVLKLPILSDDFLEGMIQNGILAGIKLSDNTILVCATEMTTGEDIDAYITAAKEVARV